jgi:ABC-type methionine transport system ATPase subunit
MLSASHLTFGYGVGAILRDVSLRLQPGRILAVAGGSGAGKTTLLKCLLLLLRPESGEIAYFDNLTFSCDLKEDGGMPSDWDEARLRSVRARIGYVPQGSVLFPSMTLVDNICLPLRLIHGMKGDADGRARDALQRLGIEGLAGAKPWRISGGQLQRAAIARAFAASPAVYLLDEPTGSLDAANVQLVGAQLRSEVEDRDCSALVVTHNLGFARTFCDEVAVLKDGTLGEPLPVGTVDWETTIQELL